MNKRPWLLGAALGVASSLPVIALLYADDQLFGLPFVPFDIFDWLARILPGPVVTFGIDLLVGLIRGLNLGPTSTTAKLAEMTMAVLLFVEIAGLIGVVLALVGRGRPANLPTYGILSGVLALALTLFVEAALGAPPAGYFLSFVWLSLIYLIWGSLLALRLQFYLSVEDAGAPAGVLRRDFLYLIGAGALGYLTVALGLSRSRSSPETAPAVATQAVVEAVAETTASSAASPSATELASRIEIAPGTRPELTPNELFYRIDINTRSPVVDPATWGLDIQGTVDRPMTLTLDDLRARPAVTQVITLSCISNPIGGDMIGTSRWTGVRLKDLLAEVGLRPETDELQIQSVDGFYESVTMADMMDERTLLVYEMNGEPLTPDHGFPVRIYIPNRYGMKQPKWIMRMTAQPGRGSGYWVDRGWSQEAFVQTTSVIDTVAVDHPDPETQTVPVGGIAYSGARGISRVEVQVDEGPWIEAELVTPPLSPLTWVLWRFDWPHETGRHTFRVRAYDGAGKMQIVERDDPRPNGATGIHSKTVTA